jgi:tetratricopeptide (TPR) repeat protein
MPAAFLATLFLLGASIPERTIPQTVTNVAAQEATSVQDQVDRGAAFLDDSHFDEAIQVFDAVLARSPDHGLALASRAMAYALTNRLAEATRDVDAAARAMPDAAILHRVRAIIADRRSDPATELAEFSRSLELEPDNPFALRFRAQLYEDAGNNEAALADADAYIAARPEDPEGHVLKAGLLIGQREPGRAAAEADLLIRLFPEDAEAHASAARIYDGLADRGRALAAIDDAIRRAPDNPYYRMWRAGMRRWDDFAGRRADLDAALALDSSNNDVITRLGLLDFKERKWGQAIARFSSVLALEPRDFGLLAYRAMARLNDGDRVLAERDFRAASAAASGADDFSRICGALGGEGFALDWAMESCNRAIELDATQSLYRAHRGLVELRLGRLDAALADYNAAVQADERLADGYYGRALVLLRRGQRQPAEADRRRALAIDPGITEAYQEYGFTDF